MILLTGATGHIGGRLLGALERRSVAVRCLCRNPEALRGRVAPGTQVVPGDLLHPRRHVRTAFGFRLGRSARRQLRHRARLAGVVYRSASWRMPHR